ncbi:hypothetical protein C8J55DRAFT_610178 [Lentinula edodes]|uniref:Uncharacterized protein n=1 Tax=Lentinula lateritia TaxID=40482 RepID=A0A9W8ZQE2_9AGAR|nr:hypothetical protein C8J55DRAFT_610317 [Lentinula edodes]KAJ4464036.1 hypothetical protein C8J55DRAFT_610178 [Lentinula edodes]
MTFSTGVRCLEKMKVEGFLDLAFPTTAYATWFRNALPSGRGVRFGNEACEGASTSNVDSARANLAGTFVNTFVNAGFGNDKLMVDVEAGSSCIYKNKDHGMISAAASLGLNLLWDTDMGLTHIDTYTYSAEEYIKAGCYLAIGISNASIRTETDAALALLAEHVGNKSVSLRTDAIMGLGMAYAGSQREEVMATLIPLIMDEDVSMEICSLAALALGFVFRGDKELEGKWARFLSLRLGLLYLGQQNGSDATLKVLKAIEKPISKTAQVIVEGRAFARTTNVLRIQKMLHECDEHIVPAKEDQKKVGDREKKEGEEKKDGEEVKEEPSKQDDAFQTFAVRYYHKEADCLFMVRIAQGLVHMGKGTVGVNPLFSDRSIMHKHAVAGLLAVLTAFTDAKGFILDKQQWMVYFLLNAMYPRFMITLDEELNNVPVAVRVAQYLCTFFCTTGG